MQSVSRFRFDDILKIATHLKLRKKKGDFLLNLPLMFLKTSVFKSILSILRLQSNTATMDF